ncbi:MAG: mechanosensitive ion channel, partial [Candidatus Brocadiaceae bacterium]
DIEKARVKAEEVKALSENALRENESVISALKSDMETTSAYLEQLQLEKKLYEGQDINPSFLKLLDRERGLVKQKINVDKEQIQVYKDYSTTLQDRTMVYANWVSLLDSVNRLKEIIASTPADYAVTVRKEADVAKGYIPAIQASIREKETLISSLSKESEDVKARLMSKDEELAKTVDALSGGIRDKALLKRAQEKARSILSWKKSLSTQWITIFQIRLENARIRYDVEIQELKNAELNIMFLAEKAKRLEEKLRTKQLRKLQAELKAAKKDEELAQKDADTARLEIEKTFQEALKKVDEITRKQLETTSSEKMRVLELEANVYHHIGLAARENDEFIAVDLERYKDTTEYKKIAVDIEQLLKKTDTSKPKEIDKTIKIIDGEIDRLSDAVTTMEAFIPSLREEQKLVSENLSRANEEIERAEKNTAKFEDKTLASQAVDYTRQIAKTLEDQSGLLSSRLDKMSERLEIKQNTLAMLNKTKEKLLNLKAASVWTRKENNISIRTISTLHKDFMDFSEQISTQVYTQAKTFAAYVSERKNTFGFWMRVCVILALIAGCYFSRHYTFWWSDKTQTDFGALKTSYLKTRLIPSLVIILLNSLNSIWAVIFSVTIAGLFKIETPLMTSIISVAAFIAIYKVLKGFLDESFSPEKEDKNLVISLAYLFPKHLYKPLNVILLFSLITLSIITVFSLFEFKGDFIELLWFIFRVGMLALLLWLATQKTLILKLLPDAESRLGRIIHRIIKIIYPILIFFIVSLFTIRSLGYTVLTYTFLMTCLKSFLIAFIAFWIGKFLHYRLNYVRDRRLKKEHFKKGTPEEKRFHAITSLYQVSFNYVTSLAAAGVIIYVWVKTFRKAIGSPAAPYVIQEIFRETGTVLKAIGNGLMYHLYVEDGKYTTPVKIIIALVVLFASFYASRYLKRFLDEKAFHKLHIEHGLKHTLSTLTRYMIIGIASLIGLHLAGIPLKSLTIFAGAFGIGIGFGMQNIISNFVSGIILLFERPIRVGDIINLEDGTVGTIKKISARCTTIQTPSAITVTVPNSKFIENKITNWTLPTTQIRSSVKVGVAYGSDTKLVKKCLLEVASQNPGVRANPEPYVLFLEFGDSELVFELFFWTDDPVKINPTRSELNFAIDEAFQKYHIEMAFPQLDIHMRSVVPFPIQNVQEQTAYQKTQISPGQEGNQA